MAETRVIFQKLTRMRLRDASVLIQNGNLEGAYYLTGLAVECVLKACIAKNTKKHDFPPDPSSARDIYTHSLTKLVGAARLQVDLDTELRSNLAFKNKWGVVKDWDIKSRCATGGLNARDLYRAVARKNGVMQWLRQRW